MIFINLLPDIKVEFVRALRIKRLLVFLMVVLVLCCIVISSLFYFIVNIQQPATIREIEGVCPKSKSTMTEQPAADPEAEAATEAAPAAAETEEQQASTNTGSICPGSSDADIAESLSAESNLGRLNDIRKKEDAQDILTIRKQLETLPTLHQLKIRTDRLFHDGEPDDIAYLTLLIPNEGSDERGSQIKSAQFNFIDNTFTIEGLAADERKALEIHATVRFIGYENCEPDNRDTRIYPFRINDEALAGAVESDVRPAYTIKGIFSNQLFSGQIDDKHLRLRVNAEAVDPANLNLPNPPCQIPSGIERLDRTEFPDPKEEDN